MSFATEHVVLGSDTRAIDFRLTLARSIIVNWNKETVTTKPMPLGYSKDVSVNITLQQQQRTSYCGYNQTVHYFVSTTASFVNSSNQAKNLKFKLCGIHLSSSGTEKILWEKLYDAEVLAKKTHNEIYLHRDQNNNEDQFSIRLKSNNFDLIVRVVEFHLTTDAFSYKSDKTQLNFLGIGLYLDDSFKDVKFVIGDHKIMAHRSVFGFHSEVFRSMLTLDTKENDTRVIEIKDTNAIAFEAFIKYLYTGEIDNMEQVANDLMVLADKYDIEGLRKECENYLCEKINENTALLLLIEADLHSYLVLKKKAIFIIKSKLDILKPEFDALTQFPHLINEIFLSIIEDKSEIEKKVNTPTFAIK